MVRDDFVKEKAKGIISEKGERVILRQSFHLWNLLGLYYKRLDFPAVIQLLRFLATALFPMRHLAMMVLVDA